MRVCLTLWGRPGQGFPVSAGSLLTALGTRDARDPALEVQALKAQQGRCQRPRPPRPPHRRAWRRACCASREATAETARRPGRRSASPWGTPADRSAGSRLHASPGAAARPGGARAPRGVSLSPELGARRSTARRRASAGLGLSDPGAFSASAERARRSRGAADWLERVMHRSRAERTLDFGAWRSTPPRAVSRPRLKGPRPREAASPAPAPTPAPGGAAWLVIDGGGGVEAVGEGRGDAGDGAGADDGADARSEAPAERAAGVGGRAAQVIADARRRAEALTSPKKLAACPVFTPDPRFAPPPAPARRRSSPRARAPRALYREPPPEVAALLEKIFAEARVERLPGLTDSLRKTPGTKQCAPRINPGVAPRRPVCAQSASELRPMPPPAHPPLPPPPPPPRRPRAPQAPPPLVLSGRAASLTPY